MPIPSLVAHMETGELRKHCDQRRQQLEIARQPWLDYCRQVAEEILPNRLPYLNDPHDSTTRGGQHNTLILDAVGHLALATVAAAIGQGTMPSSSPWFDLAVRGSDAISDASRSFLQGATTAMRAMHNQSNANHVLPEAHQEWVAFGTAAALIVEDDVDDYRLDVMSVGEYFVAEDSRGRPDTLYRDFSMTVAQLVDEFGLDALGMNTRACYERGEFDTVVACVHAIEPDRDNRNPLGQNPEMPWRSVYYERESSVKQVLAIRGYQRFPAMVWRWGKLAGSAYGYGRGHDALPHLVRLRRMIFRYGQAVAAKVDPPVQVPPGVQQHEIRTLPGQSTTVIGQSPIRNLREVDIELSELAAEIERTRQDIRDTIGASLVASLRRINRQITAREADLRTSQDLTEFLPGLYRLNEEFLSPYIEWIFDIGARRGRLPEIPMEMDGATIDIEFTSPLARKQDEAEVDAIIETSAIAGELSKLRGDVLDNMDFDAALRRVSTVKGAPVALLFDREQVAEMRQARARQQQAEAQAMAAQQGAEIARTAAQAQQVA